jgi:GTPase SAR1 family protein
MIGNTGSGKTTNILRFLGYELKPGIVKGLETLLPTKELHEDHKTFYTSPLPKSCTRFINAVKVPAQMYKKNTP